MASIYAELYENMQRYSDFESILRIPFCSRFNSSRFQIPIGHGILNDLCWISCSCCRGPPKTSFYVYIHTKTYHFIAQDDSYTQELSTYAQCQCITGQVCFFGGHFANPVCDVMVKRMVSLEGTSWETMSWNCCHCSMTPGVGMCLVAI